MNVKPFKMNSKHLSQALHASDHEAFRHHPANGYRSWLSGFVNHLSPIVLPTETRVAKLFSKLLLTYAVVETQLHVPCPVT